MALPSSPPARVASILLPRTFGDYELLEEIARGGMGVVYKARQRSLNRIVAVKMILAGELAGEEHVQRFYTEAEAAAALRHPNIVSIYEVGHEAGQHFFSMEYVDGCGLDALIGVEGMSPMEAAAILCSVSEAIHYAHEHGVIHRDLKPQNILIDQQCQPQVTDFGLAKLTESGSDLTRTGTVMGTPTFMSPEQASGDPTSVGPASDVYSLGAILFMALTGRPPYDDDNHLEVLLQVRESEPPSPRSINRTLPPDLDTICLKCLAKKPDDRYASAGELAADLDRFLEGEPIHALRLSLPRRIARWARQEPVLASAYFCGLIFYATHLFSMLVLNVESEKGLFHWVLTSFIFGLTAAATIMRKLLVHPRWRRLGLYLFFTLTPLFFMLPLAMHRGVSGTPVNLYLLLVVVALLFSEGPRLIWTAVGMGAVCYSCLLLYGVQFRPDTLIPIKDRIIFYVLLLAMGMIVHLIMRRTRPAIASGTLPVRSRPSYRSRSGGSSQGG